MATAIRYRDIPKEERRRLGAEVYRRNKWKIRALYLACVFVPLLVYQDIAATLLPRKSHLDQSVAGGLVAAALAATLCVATLVFVIRPLIQRQVVKARNAQGMDGGRSDPSL